MAQLSPGASLSHYRIVSQLGAGGIAELYLAPDTKLAPKVALKVLSADLSYFPSWYAVHPLLDDLRADPRFADLGRRVELAKMG